MQHHLRRVVALGFQQERVHVRLTRDACCFRLHCLCPSYLQSVGGGIGVQGHVLRLEGCGVVAILKEDTTKGSRDDTFAHVATRSNEHDGM